MEKRGSRYLRYVLFNATKYVCLWDPTFFAYLAKKRAEGKHYNVTISHAAKNWCALFSQWRNLDSHTDWRYKCNNLNSRQGPNRPQLCYTLLNLLPMSSTILFWGGDFNS